MTCELALRYVHTWACIIKYVVWSILDAVYGITVMVTMPM